MTASTRNDPDHVHPLASGEASERPVIRISDDLLIDRETLQSFARNHHIRTMSVFGSTARGDATSESDIDLLVEFEPGKAPSLGTLVELQEALSGLFGGRTVDVATPSILRNPYRRRAIEQEARTLYAA